MGIGSGDRLERRAGGAATGDAAWKASRGSGAWPASRLSHQLL